MSLVDGRLAQTLEEMDIYDYEIRQIVGKNYVIADALSRSPFHKTSENSDSELSPNEYIPEGYEIMIYLEEVMPCLSLSLYLCGYVTNYHELRVTIVDKYKLKIFKSNSN